MGLATAVVLALSGCDGGDNPNSVPRAVDPEPDSLSPPIQNPHPYDAPPISEAQKAEFLNAINAARSVVQDCGEYGVMPAVPALAWSNELYNAAYEHCDDMQTSGVYSRQGSGTSSDWTSVVNELGRASLPEDRAVNNGYTAIA